VYKLAMFRFFLQFFILFIFLTFSSHSKNYEKIIINGNERISHETILVFSEISDDQSLDEDSINVILKKLFSTGFFENVSIKLDNNNLIIDVVENPIIQEVFISGIKRSKTVDDLYDLLSLKNRSSFNLTLANQDELNIVNFLKEKGFYFASVTSSIEDIGNKKVNLRYNITEGKKAKISKISFIGDKKFKDNILRSIIISEEYKFWKIISGKKFLNESIIKFDTRLLENFYKNKGYYNAEIESSFANYLGNNEFELIYSIHSNDKYYFNDLTLKLPIDFEDSNFTDLKFLFQELNGEHYSLNSINKILKKIDNIVLNEQFEFLESTVDEEIFDNKINLTFNVKVSDIKSYVEKINIYGNNITREDVIRNNLIVDEGDAFNELLQTKGINRIKSLNFFKDVKSEINIGSDDTKKIINITVEEKPTGEITAGAGLGTGGGTFGFSVKENNFLGKGVSFGSDLTIGTNSIKGSIAVENPNYKGSEKSVNFSAENSSTDNLKDYGYKSNKTGFSIGTGHEYYDNLFIRTGISMFVEKLDTDTTASINIKNQDGSYFDTLFNYTLDYDMRNQRFRPSDGFRSKFSQRIQLLSKSYTMISTYDYNFYHDIFDENIASFKLYTSTANTLTNKNVRLSERLYLPASKLRGFESGKVGPKDGTDYVGGNYLAAVNMAISLPQILPTIESTNFSIFFDAANIWGVDYSDSLADGSKIRSSIGLAIDFLTPVGPLNIVLSEIISKDTTDVSESFRFNLGTTF